MAENEWSIRVGTPEDWEIIAEFNQRLAMETEEKELPANVIGPGVQEVLGDRMKGVYYCSEANGEVIGQLMITLEWSDWRNGWFHWIQSVYVRKDWRAKGVFTSLYRHAEAIAREDPEVCGLRLYVERDNSRAQGAYARLGMTRTDYQMFEVEF
ncbi:MAG: GNAT family N-acetyltransferase [Verrucomicrobiales bacterium]|nr:GNAT family N-acetyltransferase [Verrucomicrobiales bacterium]|tara:strand:+ start:11131 stop:11592 length:462 start_codon:yes stop_codon:yes gene_type:complete